MNIHLKQLQKYVTEIFKYIPVKYFLEKERMTLDIYPNISCQGFSREKY